MSRYEILERIGMGGMAEVFRGVAVSEGGFQKPVAIKKILPHLGRDPRFIQMLIAEAKMLASLRQRSIVQIYDLGQDEDEQYFLVMEYVDGMDLADLQEFLEEGGEKLAPLIALHIGAEIADALDHAHSSTAAPGGKGVIHRDVSPANVLLSYSGEVKLTDFGIAKHGEQSIIASLKGKFAYMSPEQARAMPLDGTSDQFCLGLVLYELMTGRRVFSHLADMDALRLARESVIPPPSLADPDFPRAIEPILVKAMDPDPRRRYATAGEMANALRKARYALSTDDEPGVALAALLRRFGLPRGPGKERSPVDRERSVVKLSTAFLFDDLDLEGRGGQGAVPLGPDVLRGVRADIARSARDEARAVAAEEAAEAEPTLYEPAPTDPDAEKTGVSRMAVGPGPGAVTAPRRAQPASRSGGRPLVGAVNQPTSLPPGTEPGQPSDDAATMIAELPLETPASFDREDLATRAITSELDATLDPRASTIEDEVDDLRRTEMRPAVRIKQVLPGSAYPGFAAPTLAAATLAAPGGPSSPSGAPAALAGSSGGPGLPRPRAESAPDTGSWTPPPALEGRDAAIARFPVSPVPPISLRRAGIVIGAIVLAVIVFAAIVSDPERPAVTIPADEQVDIAAPDATPFPPDAAPRKKKKRRSR